MAVTQLEPVDGAQIAPSSYRDVLRSFRTVAEALSDTLELDVLLHLIADQVCGLLGANRCSILLLDKQSGLFRGRVGRSALDIDARVKRLVGGLPADGFTHEIVATRRPVMLSNAMSDPRAMRAAMRDWNTHSVLGVPMILRDEVIGIMYIDDEGESHLFSTLDQELALTFAGLAATAIVQAQLNAELRSTFSKVARQNDLLRRASALEDQLTELILSSSSLREVCHAMTALIKKPCALYDARFSLLASSAPDGIADQVSVRLFEHDVRVSPLVAEELEELIAGNTRIIGPFPSLDISRRLLSVPIVRNAEPLGYLIVVEHRTRFGALDAMIARRAAAQIALDMGAERRSEGAKWHAVESFVAALLRGSHDEEWLRERSDYVNVALDAPRVVCLVQARERGMAPSARALSGELNRAGDRINTMLTPMGSELAAVIELESGCVSDAVEAAGERLRRSIEQLAPELDVLIAVSTPSERGDHLPRAYDEASQVMRCMRGHLGGAGTHVLTAEELGAGRLFLAMADAHDALQFVDRALGALLEQGDAKSYELLHTLHEFLAASGNARRAAERLGVHQNTVRYRIGRIEELTGLPVWSDSNAQMTAHLSLLVLRLGDRLPGVGMPGRPIVRAGAEQIGARPVGGSTRVPGELGFGVG